MTEGREGVKFGQKSVTNFLNGPQVAIWYSKLCDHNTAPQCHSTDDRRTTWRSNTTLFIALRGKDHVNAIYYIPTVMIVKEIHVLSVLTA